MTTLVVDVYKEMVVATVYVVDTYLNTLVDNLLAMKLEGKMVDYMVQADPEKYSKCVRMEYGKKVLYLGIVKALYGCIKSGIIRYKLFSEILSGHGFVLNPYDLCILNKTIEGKYCTLTWYMDDLKISHVKSSIVDSVIVTIESHFGQMTVTRGKKHMYVEIEIDFIGDRKVTLF